MLIIYKSETITLRQSKQSVLSLSNDNQTSSKYTLQISLCYSDFTPSSTYDEATGSEDSPTESSISTEEFTSTTESTTTTLISTESTADTEYDDDSDDLTVIDRYKNDNEEILTTNKKIIRFLSDEINMKSIINETVNEYYQLNKVAIISTAISIISDDNNKTLKITVDLIIDNKYLELSKTLEEYININKNNTFYNILSNRCNNIYTLCSNDDDNTTNTPIIIIPECIYPSKSIFIYGSGIKTISNNNTIITDGIIITYSTSSSLKECNIDKNIGNIKIDTNTKINEGFIKCKIICK